MPRPLNSVINRTTPDVGPDEEEASRKEKKKPGQSSFPRRRSDVGLTESAGRPPLREEKLFGKEIYSVRNLL